MVERMLFNFNRNMKEFIQVLRRFVPPYKKFLILHVIFNVLSAILNIFSFMLIVPILQILFKMQEANYSFIPWGAEGSFKDIAINCLSRNGDCNISSLINAFLVIFARFLFYGSLPSK